MLQKVQYEASYSVCLSGEKKMCEDKRISVVALRAIMANPFTSEADLETVLEDHAQVTRQL